MMTFMIRDVFFFFFFFGFESREPTAYSHVRLRIPVNIRSTPTLS